VRRRPLRAVYQSAADSALLGCELDAVFTTGRDLCTAACTIDRDRCRFSVADNPCGNGVAEGYEECDGGDLRGLTCADLGGSGDLACHPFCLLDRSGCRDVAGNGRREDGEVCDIGFDFDGPTDLGGATCESLGYGTGTLECWLSRRSWRNQPPVSLQDFVLLPRLATYECTQPGTCGDGQATDGGACDRDDLRRCQLAPPDARVGSAAPPAARSISRGSPKYGQMRRLGA
jgi:hypothetical protein